MEQFGTTQDWQRNPESATAINRNAEVAENPSFRANFMNRVP
jgi:hypothetical protein